MQNASFLKKINANSNVLRRPEDYGNDYGPCWLCGVKGDMFQINSFVPMVFFGAFCFIPLD